MRCTAGSTIGGDRRRDQPHAPPGCSPYTLTLDHGRRGVVHLRVGGRGRLGERRLGGHQQERGGERGRSGTLHHLLLQLLPLPLRCLRAAGGPAAAQHAHRRPPGRLREGLHPAARCGTANGHQIGMSGTEAPRRRATLAPGAHLLGRDARRSCMVHQQPSAGEQLRIARLGEPLPLRLLRLRTRDFWAARRNESSGRQ